MLIVFTRVLQALILPKPVRIKKKRKDKKRKERNVEADTTRS